MTHAEILFVLIVWHLVKVFAQRRYEAKLIFPAGIENHGSKSPEPVALIVQHLQDRRLQTVITSVGINTRIVSKTLGVTAEVQMFIRLIEVSVGDQQLAFAFSIKPAARHHIEYSISSIPVLGTVSAALNFQIVYVLGIELRPNRIGNVGVRDWNPINQPGHLMPAPNVQLIVGDVRARHIIGNHRHAIAPIRAGGLRDLLSGNESYGSWRVRAHFLSSNGGYFNGLRKRSELQLETQGRGAVGKDRN